MSALLNSCEAATATNHSTRSCSRLRAAIGQMNTVTVHSVDQYRQSPPLRSRSNRFQSNQLEFIICEHILSEDN